MQQSNNVGVVSDVWPKRSQHQRGNVNWSALICIIIGLLAWRTIIQINSLDTPCYCTSDTVDLRRSFCNNKDRRKHSWKSIVRNKVQEDNRLKRSFTTLVGIRHRDIFDLVGPTRSNNGFIETRNPSCHDKVQEDQCITITYLLAYCLKYTAAITHQIVSP
jgi:hypothetical protein